MKLKSLLQPYKVAKFSAISRFPQLFSQNDRIFEFLKNGQINFRVLYYEKHEETLGRVQGCNIADLRYGLNYQYKYLT